MTDRWSAEMDRRLDEMRRDPVGYVDRARAGEHGARRGVARDVIGFLATAVLVVLMGVAVACAVLAFVVLPVATAVGAL